MPFISARNSHYVQIGGSVKSYRKTKLLWLQEVKRNENLHLPPESQITIGSNAFKGTTIQDENLRPQEKGKSYKTVFVKRGISKKIVIKKM